MTTIVCDAACTVTLSISVPPFDLSTEDAALISAAVIAVWALAWGFRMLVRTVRTTDTPETD